MYYRKLKFLICFVAFSASFTFFIILLLYDTTEDKVSVAFHPKRKSTDLKTYPRPWRLIDIEFRYLINNLVCHDAIPARANSSDKSYIENRSIFMLILITSHAGDVEIRKKIRQILPKKELDRLQMKRLFLLAKPPLKSKDQKYHSVKIGQIQEEDEEFRDILMGNFDESYHNLTYKHLMGLEWASRFCSQATYILKQDDDVIVDFYQLSTLLQQTDLYVPLVQEKMILGKVLEKYDVVRDLKSKWFVSRKEFLKDVYPSFVSGWAYITTPKVVKLLVERASQYNYFWIDDVHITGTLRDSGQIKLLDLDKYFTIYKGQLQCCVSTSAYSKSKTNQPYWCDFVVGPSNDDLELMEIFQNHARFCHTTKMCLRRSDKEALNSTCVITEKMVVNNFKSYSEVNLSPKGKWKQIKL